MQTIEQARETTSGRSLEELRKRLLLLEEERARLVANDGARLTQLIDAIDQEYAEQYEAIELLLAGDSRTEVPTPTEPVFAPPHDPVDPTAPTVTADWPVHRPISRWLASSITTCAVVLGLITLMSTRGEASPTTETHIPAPIIVLAAEVPDDPETAGAAVSLQAPAADPTPKSTRPQRKAKRSKRSKTSPAAACPTTSAAPDNGSQARGSWARPLVTSNTCVRSG